MKAFVAALLVGASLATGALAETKPSVVKPGAATAPRAAASPQATPPAGPQKEWKEAIDDWIVACVQGANGQKSCAMSQTLSNAQSRQVIGIITIGKDATGKIFANIQTPLGFAVSSGLQLVIDSQPGLPVPVRTCIANGCLGILELDAATVGQLQKAAKLTVSMQSLQAQPITLAFSAKGLGKAYDKLMQEGR